MAPGSHRVHIRKEALKFSAAHMTVFPDGSKERLHGHNYRTELTVDVRDAGIGSMVSFTGLKEALREICEAWDERVLLAERCPWMKLAPSGTESLEFELCGKRYALPREDAVLLPLENVTTEALSEELCRLLRLKLATDLASGRIIAVEVRVEEISGQGASFRWEP